MTWLLDTCVLSEYVKRAPNGRGIAWVDARPEARLFISALTLAELLRRVVKRRASDPPRADRLAAWCDKSRHDSLAASFRSTSRPLAFGRSAMVRRKSMGSGHHSWTA